MNNSNERPCTFGNDLDLVNFPMMLISRFQEVVSF